MIFYKKSTKNGKYKVFGNGLWICRKIISKRKGTEKIVWIIKKKLKIF